VPVEPFGGMPDLEKAQDRSSMTERAILFCSYCGAKLLAPNVRFCAVCGGDLAELAAIGSETWAVVEAATSRRVSTPSSEDESAAAAPAEAAAAALEPGAADMAPPGPAGPVQLPPSPPAHSRRSGAVAPVARPAHLLMPRSGALARPAPRLASRSATAIAPQAAPQMAPRRALAPVPAPEPEAEQAVRSHSLWRRVAALVGTVVLLVASGVFLYFNDYLPVHPPGPTPQIIIVTPAPGSAAPTATPAP
jgi:hypothetical protein